MKEKYHFYSDPGHGWLAVKRIELVQLGILDKITDYSYQRGKSVYLEEDCDMNTFITAFENKYGFTPTIIDHTSDNRSPIRSYHRFIPYKIILPE